MASYPKWVVPHDDHVADQLSKQGFQVFKPRGGPMKVLATCAQDVTVITSPPERT